MVVFRGRWGNVNCFGKNCGWWLTRLFHSACIGMPACFWQDAGLPATLFAAARWCTDTVTLLCIFSAIYMHASQLLRPYQTSSLKMASAAVELSRASWYPGIKLEVSNVLTEDENRVVDERRDCWLLLARNSRQELEKDIQGLLARRILFWGNGRKKEGLCGEGNKTSKRQRNVEAWREGVVGALRWSSTNVDMMKRMLQWSTLSHTLRQKLYLLFPILLSKTVLLCSFFPCIVFVICVFPFLFCLCWFWSYYLYLCTS